MNPNMLIGVLAAAGIVVSLAQTLVVPIIGSLPEIFGTSSANAAWIITVTLLAGAVATPVLGRLADMYGKKPMMLIAIIPFIVGSVVCAVAGSLPTMIAGRGLQGLASGMVPLGISLLHDVLPKDKAGSGIAFMSSSMGIGGALGLPLAAAVAQFASWRALFWVTAAVALITAVAIWKVIPSTSRGTHKSGRFDFVGAIGLAAGLVPLLLAVSKGSEWGWGSTLALGCFAFSAVVLVAWGWYELRQKDGLVDLRTTVQPVVLLTNLAAITVGFSMYALNLILPQVMQLPTSVGYGLGQSMLQMGLWMAPMGLGMMLVSSLGARITRTRVAKVTLSLAGLIIAVGYGAVALIVGTIVSADSGVPTTWVLILLMLSSVIIGCGIGFAFGAQPALIMSAVPAHQKAAANGFNSLMRSFGTTASAAVIGVVLAAMTQQLGDAVIPSQAGFVVSLLIGCGSALVTAILAAVIPGNPKAAAGH